MTGPFHLPQPYAAPVIAVIVIAVCYLALVDWTHPNPIDKDT